MWEIEYTDQFGVWWDDLDEGRQRHVTTAVEALAEGGPGLGRPWVDGVKGSVYPNMKELRPRAGNMRVLFAFDPKRMAILLIGGDKTDDWKGWYKRMVPVADALYAEHLKEAE